MKRNEKICEIMGEIKSVNFKIERGILGSTKVCFNEKLRRQIRENIEKCFKNNKLKTIWGETCVVVK